MGTIYLDLYSRSFKMRGAATFSLMLYYPKRLVPAWVGWGVIGAFLAWYVAQAIGLFPDLTFARRSLALAALYGSFGLGAIHWFRTRRDPIARALRWQSQSGIIPKRPNEQSINLQGIGIPRSAPITRA